MTPKLKAEELVDKYLPWTRDWDIKNYAILNAKQCALIAVEFAREQFHNHCCAEIGTNGSPDDHFDAIKQEIEKL